MNVISNAKSAPLCHFGRTQSEFVCSACNIAAKTNNRLNLVLRQCNKNELIKIKAFRSHCRCSPLLLCICHFVRFYPSMILCYHYLKNSSFVGMSPFFSGFQWMHSSRYQCFNFKNATHSTSSTAQNFRDKMGWKCVCTDRVAFCIAFFCLFTFTSLFFV